MAIELEKGNAQNSDLVIRVDFSRGERLATITYFFNIGFLILFFIAMSLMISGCSDDDDSTQVTTSKIEITTPPAKKDYRTIDKVLDLTGMVVTATMSDNTKKTVTEYTTSTPDFTTAGDKKVTVTYDGKTADFTITVQAKPDGGGTTDVNWIKTQYLNVAYAAKSSAQVMDIYIPNEGTGPFPLIISIHGGAFKSGDKADGQESPMIGTAQSGGIASGYAVASINYRLSGEAKWPAQINDIKAAIRFLRVHAAEYSLNPDKFATWGGSAGGNLAALAAVTGGVKELADDTLGNAGVSDAIQAGVDWFGPIYFSTMDAEFAALGQIPAMGATNTATSPETAYLGKTIGTAEAEPLVIAASPQTYITSDDPAFFIQHGTADRNIPITQSENFAKKLAAVLGANKVFFEKLEGAGHGTAEFSAVSNVAKVIVFLDKNLKADAAQ